MIESLDPVAEEQDQAEIERAWLAEIKRRAGEIDRGEVELIPGDEVFARLREKFRPEPR